MQLRRALLVLAMSSLAAPASAFAGRAYVADLNGSSVTPIDTATNTPFGAAIPLANNAPNGIAITPDGKFAFVTSIDFGTNNPALTKIDTATNAVVGSPLLLGASSNPQGVAITPNGKFAYVAARATNDVRVIDTATNTQVGAPISIGASTGPDAVAITPDGKFAYVANHTSNNVSIIDTATNTVVGSPIAVGTSPHSLVVTPDGAKIYVANVGGGVTVISTATNMVTGTVTVGTQPIALAITPNGTHAYVANSSGGTVSVIDTATDTVVGSPITVGTNPIGVGITPDGTTAYASNGSSDTLSAIDTASNTVPGAGIPAGDGPLGIAIQPAAPHAEFTFPAHRGARHSLSFDAANSSDPGAQITHYSWDFGDGSTANLASPQVSHTYAFPGTYQASLTLTDSAGCSSQFVFTGQTASCDPHLVKLTKTVLVPSNVVRLGKLKLLDNGTALLFVHVPGAGTLKLTGNGVQTQRPARFARPSLGRHVSAAGTVKLKIKAKGKARKKLNQKGKVKVKVKITFTPTDGVAGHKHRSVRLKKQL